MNNTRNLFAFIKFCSESTVVTGVGAVSPASTLDRVNDLLAILLDLHVQHCGDAVMCREINDSLIESTTTMFPKPCCIPCSCLPTCGAEQNCCPFVNTLPKTSDQSTINESHELDNPFYTKHKVPQIHERAKNETPSPKNRNESKSNDTKLAFDAKDFLLTTEDEETAITPKKDVGTIHIDGSNFKSYENDGFDAETQLKTVCVRPQLFYKPNLYPDSEAYEMIVYCPSDYGDALVAEKCRHGNRNDNIEDVIPVTSKDSGLTYMNKHCLFCNEKNSTRIVEEWQIQIIDEKSVYHHQTYQHPQFLKEMDPVTMFILYRGIQNQ